MTHRPAIYLDHAATSPRPREEGDRPGRRPTGANPSSPHRAGTEARRALEEARDFLKGSLGASRLLFTSGATEANNLAILGRCQGNRPGRILALASDHPSILEPLKHLAGRGRRVDLLPVDRQGRLERDTLERALDGDLLLLCLVLGNNETGALQDLAMVTAAMREQAPQAQLHVDAVQAFGRLRIDLEDDRIDSLSLSGHKLGAPPGIGALALAPRVRLAPILFGGGQEEGLRPGTENLPGALELAAATEATLAGGHAEWTRLEGLKTRLTQGLCRELPDTVPVGQPEGGLPQICNLSFPGIPAEVLVHHLADAGIMVGAGSACSGRKKGTSHVLTAMGLPDREARSALRFSFGPTTREEEIDRVIQVLPPLVTKLRRIGIKG